MDKDLEIFCVIAKIFKRSFEIDQNEKAFRDLDSGFVVLGSKIIKV